MLMDRRAIADLIPHGPGMCMLDELLSWDSDSIECVSRPYQRNDNPLLHSGRLHCACLVEYCAQAAALHGALSQQGEGRASLAYLGAVKNLELCADYVDAATQSLTIAARCVVNNSGGSIYLIEASAPQQLLLNGRIVLVMAGPKAAPAHPRSPELSSR